MDDRETVMAMFYEIKVQGKLKASWSDWFQGMTIYFEVEGDGSPVTTLRGAVVDQTALHGLFARIRDLGLPLLSVYRLPTGDPDVNQGGARGGTSKRTQDSPS